MLLFYMWQYEKSIISKREKSHQSQAASTTPSHA